MNDNLKKLVQDELKQVIVKVSLPTNLDIEAGFRGTGFFITTDGYILTAWHCIEDFFKVGIDILIECCDGEVFPAELDEEKTIKNLDIAVVKIDHQIDKCIPLLKHVPKTYQGDKVVSVCYSGVHKKKSSCFSGNISLVETYDFVATNVIQGPGQSGGPVYHYGANRIIGVVTKTYNADKLRNAGSTAKLDFLFSRWKELSKTNDEVANAWEKRLPEQVTDDLANTKNSSVNSDQPAGQIINSKETFGITQYGNNYFHN
jgi:S1-C subfamily serine protease